MSIPRFVKTLVVLLLQTQKYSKNMELRVRNNIVCMNIYGFAKNTII